MVRVFKLFSVIGIAFSLSLEQEITALLGLKSIYYDFDKADLRPDAILELDKVVRFMNKHSKIEEKQLNLWDQLMTL